jgi:DNA-binding NarL/FixJ family response regulator
MEKLRGRIIVHYTKREQAVEIISAETPVAPLLANPIRVLVVDSHPLVREAVYRVLNPLLEVKLVVSVSNYQEAEMQATRLRPEIIWLDMHIAHGNGIAEIPRLRKLSPEARIIVLADVEDEQEAFAAIMAGAQGYRSNEEVDPDEVVAMNWRCARQ